MERPQLSWPWEWPLPSVKACHNLLFVLLYVFTPWATAADSLSYEPVGRALSLYILFQLFGSEVCGEHHHPLSTIINQVLWGWIRQNPLHLERQTDNNEIMASETGDKSAISPAAALKSYLLKISDKALRIELRWEQKQNSLFSPASAVFCQGREWVFIRWASPVKLEAKFKSVNESGSSRHCQ